MNSVILIVEDDAPLRTGMLALLRLQGHAVRAAATIAEARGQLDATPPPTHVILDLNLPDGLGTDLLRTICTGATQPRVMVLTGSAEPDVLAEVQALGVDAVLTKPPNWDEVIRWASLR